MYYECVDIIDIFVMRTLVKVEPRSNQLRSLSSLLLEFNTITTPKPSRKK